MIRALTMLNEHGDTTLVWSPDRDDDMEAIIQKKMDEGCIFYVIEPRFGTREVLRDARHANRNRMLAIRDEDFAKFVGASVPASAGVVSENATPPTAAVVDTPAAPVKTVRRGRTAREVARSESVGMKPRRGG